MMRSSLLALLILALPASAAELLSLDKALKTALEHQPQIRQAGASVAASKARSQQAAARMLPQVSMGANYQPGGPNQTSNGLNMSLSADQLLYDWGQSSNQHQAALTLAASQEDTARLVRIQVMQEVRTAYFAARAAEALQSVAREALQNQQRHLDQVKNFVSIGTRPPIDLAQANKDYANAQVQLIEAQNAYEIAKAQLNLAMGVEGSTAYALADGAMAPVPGEDQTLDSLMKEAIKQHPEYTAFAKQVKAQELTFQAMKAEGMPALRAGARVGDPELNLSNWNWQAGVTFSWPLFSGGAPQAQREEAEANLTRVTAQQDQLRQRIRLEVEQARLAVRAEKAALLAAGQSTKNAQEQLKLAEGRYSAGLGSVIELGDAQLALTNARAQEVQVNTKLANARISLLKALGRL